MERFGLMMVLSCFVTHSLYAHPLGEFHYFLQRVNQTTARHRCESQGLLLAHPSTKEAYEDLVSRLPVEGSYWLGLERYDGRWSINGVSGDVTGGSSSSGHQDVFEWIDGEVAIWQHWEGGQPDAAGDCVAMCSKEPNGWRDMPCANKRRYICQEDESTYHFFTMRVSQDTAKLNCEVQGWSLATPKTPAAYQHLVDQLPSTSTWWIGLERRARGDGGPTVSPPATPIGDQDMFVWHDGSPVTWTNWDEESGQPDDSGLEGEDCVVMLSTHNLPWWDVPCFLSRYYICQGVHIGDYGVGFAAATTTPTTTTSTTTTPKPTTTTTTTTTTTSPPPPTTTKTSTTSTTTTPKPTTTTTRTAVRNDCAPQDPVTAPPATPATGAPLTPATGAPTAPTIDLTGDDVTYPPHTTPPPPSETTSDNTGTTPTETSEDIKEETVQPEDETYDVTETDGDTPDTHTTPGGVEVHTMPTVSTGDVIETMPPTSNIETPETTATINTADVETMTTATPTTKVSDTTATTTVPPGDTDPGAETDPDTTPDTGPDTATGETDGPDTQPDPEPAEPTPGVGTTTTNTNPETDPTTSTPPPPAPVCEDAACMTPEACVLLKSYGMCLHHADIVVQFCRRTCGLC